MKKGYEDDYGYRWTMEELKARGLYAAEYDVEGHFDEYEEAYEKGIVIDGAFCDDTEDGYTSSDDNPSRKFVRIVQAVYSDDDIITDVIDTDVGWTEIYNILPDDTEELDRKCHFYTEEGVVYGPFYESDVPSKALTDLTVGDRCLTTDLPRSNLTAQFSGYTAVCYYNSTNKPDFDANDQTMPMTFSYIVEDGLMYLLVKLPVGWYKLLAWPFCAPEISAALRSDKDSNFDKLHLILVERQTGKVKGIHDIVLRSDFASWFTDVFTSFTRRASLGPDYRKKAYGHEYGTDEEKGLSNVELAYMARRRCGRDPDVAGPEEDIW